MKILFIHPAYMDYRKYIFDQLNSTYDVQFVFTKHGRGQENVKEEHEKLPSEWNYKNIKSSLILINKDIGMYFSLVKELLFEDYDVVVTSTSRYICWVGAKFRRKKFVFMTEFWYWKDTSLLRTILNRFTKLIAQNSDSIFAMGTNASNSYLHMGVENDKIFMHPQCAVDYSMQPVFDIRQKYALEDNIVILFMGRIVSLKGINYLLKSFSMLEKEDSRVFLLIAGEGPKKEEYISLASELGIRNIHFVGHVLKKQLASYYYACDVFVLPSIFNKNSYEPWGLVINEAMAFGKPIVTTDAVGAGTDLVLNGTNGYVVTAGNINELYYALKKIVSNNDLMNNMGLESRCIFEQKNNYKNMFLKFKKAIDSVQG